MNPFTTSSIRNKILLSVTPMILLIMLLSGLISNQIMAERIKKEFEDRIQDSAKAAMAYFKDYQYQCLNDAMIIGKMSNIRDALSGSSTYEMFQTLSSVTGDMPLVDDIQIFDEKGELRATGLNTNFQPHNAAGDILFKAGMVGANQLKVEISDNKVLIKGVGPIQEYVGSTRKIGVAVTTTQVDERFIKQMKGMTGLDFILYTPFKAFTTLNTDSTSGHGITRLPLLGRRQYNGIFDRKQQSVKMKKLGSSTYLSITAPLKSIRGENVAVLNAVISTKELDRALTDNLLTTLSITSIAVFAVIVLVLLISGSITRPLKKLMEDTKRLSEGYVSARTFINSKDEIGKLAGEFNTLGDFLLNIVNWLKENVTELGHTSIIILETSEQISLMSHNIFTDMKVISHGAEIQTTLVNVVNANMEDISNAASTVVEKSSEIASRSTLAARHAEEGKSRLDGLTVHIDHTRDIINAISKFLEDFTSSMKMVNNMTGCIEHIAAQSKLLALNTSIEAARLGNQSSGFNTVALKMKDLSDESSQAARNINQTVEMLNKSLTLLNTMTQTGVEAVQAGKALMQDTRNAFKTIDVSIRDIDSMSGEIACMAKIQEKEIREVLAMVQQISAISCENSTTANTATLNTSNQLSVLENNNVLAARLAGMVEQSNRVLDRFKV